jgi:hypothetical protein
MWGKEEMEGEGEGREGEKERGVGADTPTITNDLDELTIGKVSFQHRQEVDDPRPLYCHTTAEQHMVDDIIYFLLLFI